MKFDGRLISPADPPDVPVPVFVGPYAYSVPYSREKQRCHNPARVQVAWLREGAASIVAIGILSQYDLIIDSPDRDDFFVIGLEPFTKPIINKMLITVSCFD